VAQIAQQSNNDVRTPLWRRVTAVFTLSSLVVLSGLLLAGVITLTVLMLLFLLERAIA
jgi:low temperature requirement protein LtrA